MKDQTKEVEKLLIQIALKIAKQGKGCLFVIENTKVEHDVLLDQDIKPFNIFENERRVETLGLIDGAVIVSPEGLLKEYSVRIHTTQSFKGFGTRHSAGASASRNNNVSILASEEDRKVRIFKDGALVMQVDSLERGIENRSNEIVGLLESVGVGSVITLGANAVMPSLVLLPLAGVIIFSSAYFFGKKLIQKIKEQ